MKNFWYKLVMAAMVLTLSAGISMNVFAYDEAEIIDITTQYLDSWNTTDFEQLIEENAQDPKAVEQFTAWQTEKSKLGEFDSITETTVSEADGVITAVLKAKYSNNNLTLTISYDSAAVENYGAAYGVMNIDAKAGQTGGKPDMGKAALNTAMGMGIVFIVLILISGVISLLKFVPGWIGGLSGSNKAAPQKEVPAAPVSVVQEEEEELADDTELAAVITAAIMASAPAASSDGLVVRSIRRRR